MMPTDHQQKAELDERKEMCAARDARRLVCDARWDSGGVRAKALASWANCNGDDDEAQRMADVSSAQSVNETLAGGLYSANIAQSRNGPSSADE